MSKWDLFSVHIWHITLYYNFLFKSADNVNIFLTFYILTKLKRSLSTHNTYMVTENDKITLCDVACLGSFTREYFPRWKEGQMGLAWLHDCMVMHAVRQKIKGGQAQETGRGTEIRHDEGIVCGCLKGRLHDMNYFYKTKQLIIWKRKGLICK